MTPSAISAQPLAKHEDLAPCLASVHANIVNPNVGTQNPIKETVTMTGNQLSIAREIASLWRVTFNKPPVNMFIPSTIDELAALMTG